MDATCVPWPYWSVASAAVEKFFSATTWFLRSSWVASTPVSRTATLMPLPSYPAAHAVSAPICLTDLSRLALRTPSSHTWAMPEAVFAPPDRVSVMAAHRSGASPLGVSTASAFSDLRDLRTLVPPASRTSAFAAAAAPL
jgi:hypothetical protein